jgi:predicted nucleic acid-binding protein
VARQRLLTTNHVVGETYTLIRMRLGFAAAQQFVHHVRSSLVTERVFVPEAWESEAESLLSQYADQDFSYVDATSFVTMGHRALTTAFAFDHHFVVTGFTLLADE